MFVGNELGDDRNCQRAFRIALNETKTATRRPKLQCEDLKQQHEDLKLLPHKSRGKGKLRNIK